VTGTGVSRIAVWLGVGAAIAAPASQALTGWGLTAAEFSRQGDSTLRVAGYAFSIWGVIYAGLLAYAVRRMAARRGSPLDAAVDGALAAASLGCGLWIVAAGLNLRWATVLVIGSALAAALFGLSRLRRTGASLGWVDRATVLWPLALLGGWLTVASMVNVLTVLTAEGLITASSAQPAAILGVLAAAAVSLAVLWTTRCLSYALPVAWGLVGAFVAERDHQPVVADAAFAAAILLLLAAIAWRRPVRRPI
jgi:hypothetical protein